MKGEQTKQAKTSYSCVVAHMRRKQLYAMGGDDRRVTMSYRPCAAFPQRLAILVWTATIFACPLLPSTFRFATADRAVGL